MRSCTPCGACDACQLMKAEVVLKALKRYREKGRFVLSKYTTCDAEEEMYKEARAEVERLKGEK